MVRYKKWQSHCKASAEQSHIFVSLMARLCHIFCFNYSSSPLRIFRGIIIWGCVRFHHIAVDEAGGRAGGGKTVGRGAEGSCVWVNKSRRLYHLLEYNFTPARDFRNVWRNGI